MNIPSLRVLGTSRFVPLRPWSISCLLALGCFLISNVPSYSQTATLTVMADKPSHAISPTLYGIFFEDINCSADGGLYAELVRNRNFEDSDSPDYWESLDPDSSDVALSIDSSQPLSEKNLHSLKVHVKRLGKERAGVVNNGFWGIDLNKGDTYEFSFSARGQDGFSGPLLVSLESK